MSPTKMDRNFRYNSGKTFPQAGESERIGARGYAAMIADALHRGFGEERSAIRKIAEITSANERVVKNWFDGRNGPNGEFLILLCRHSDEVLETILQIAGRADLLSTKEAFVLREQLRALYDTMGTMEGIGKGVEESGEGI